MNSNTLEHENDVTIPDDEVVEEEVEEIHLPYSPDEVKEMIEITSVVGYKDLDDLGYTYPQLVLAINIEGYGLRDPDPTDSRKYEFGGKHDWLYIRHQAGGLACNQHYMIATILEPREEIKDAMKTVGLEWYGSNVGCVPAMIDDLVRYRRQLRSWLNVDCNESYPYFEEAIYPIDCTSEHLAILSSEDLPDDLDELLEGDNCAVGGWHLYILGENSD